MSLMKTLAKVAVGVAVAKGASSLMKGGGGSSGGGLGGMLGQLAGGGGGAAAGLAGMLGGAGGSSSGGGLDSMLGGLLGGGSAGGGLGQGGLGGLLEQLGGAQSGGGGLQSMLGGLGAAGAGGGMAGLLGGLAGSLANRPQEAPDSFGAVLNSQFDETPEAALTPSADQEAAAALMLRAMIQATKADGEFDADEQARLVDRLGGDVDAEEARFLKAELARPLDVDDLVNETPRGLEQQVYAMSVLGIDLDSQAEAKYLDKLAKGYGLDASAVNGIHDQLGVPALYG